MKALRNILRRSKRSCIISGIYFLLSLAMILLFIMRYAVETSISGIIGPLENCVKVDFANGSSGLPISLVEKVSESFDIIETYHGSTEGLCDIKNIKHFSAYSDEGEYTERFEPFRLTAVTSTDTQREFYSNKRYILKGAGISGEDNERMRLSVVISSELAELNELNLGDELTLLVKVDYAKEPVPAVVYIGGIYSNKVKYAENANHSYQISANQIYIPLSIYEMVANRNATVYMKELYFQMKNINLSERLEQRLRNLGTSLTMGIELTHYSRESEAEALNRVAKILDAAIICGAVCFSISFCAILFRDIHSRMEEIGMYCALGVKRKKILFLFAKEAAFLFLVAFVIASLFTVMIWVSFGDDIEGFLSAEEVSSVSETTSDKVIDGDILYEDSIAADEEKNVEVLMLSILKTAFLSLFLGFAVYLIFYGYIKQIEPLRVLSGRKEPE